jgi:hypothetical protein
MGQPHSLFFRPKNIALFCRIVPRNCPQQNPYFWPKKPFVKLKKSSFPFANPSLRQMPTTPGQDALYPCRKITQKRRRYDKFSFASSDFKSTLSA